MHRNGVGEFVLKDVSDSFEVRIVANSSVKEVGDIVLKT